MNGFLDCQKFSVSYFVGILLAGGKKFSTAEKLVKYMNDLLDDSTEAFEEFCFKLIDADNNLNEEFEAWLIALGKRRELQTWKQNLTA